LSFFYTTSVLNQCQGIYENDSEIFDNTSELFENAFEIFDNTSAIRPYASYHAETPPMMSCWAALSVGQPYIWILYLTQILQSIQIS